MAINQSSDNPVYLAYRYQGFTSALVVPAGIINFIAIFGLAMNVFVIFTTIKTNTLRGSVNFLMALVCFFEMLHQSGHLIFLGISISGTNFIDRLLASSFALPMMFGIQANMMMAFCIAFDRLFAVAFTKLHDSIYYSHKKAYLAGHVLLAIAYSIFCCFLILEFAIAHAGDPTTGCICEIIPAMSPEFGISFFLLMFIPNICAIICYVFIGLLIRCNKTVAKETHTRLLRSLVLILSVSIGAYVINLSVYQVLFNVNFGLNPVTVWEMSFLAGAFLNIGSAANFPVLFISSVEYRTAFKVQLAKIFNFLKFTKISSSIQPVNSNNSNLAKKNDAEQPHRRLSNVERV